MKRKIRTDSVQWVVNEMAELGVKIGDQFFFLYKGNSMKSGSKWRFVGKREFGECCHPWYSIKKQCGEERLPDTYVGFYPEEHQPDFDNQWQDQKKRKNSRRRTDR